MKLKPIKITKDSEEFDHSDLNIPYETYGVDIGGRPIGSISSNAEKTLWTGWLNIQGGEDEVFTNLPSLEEAKQAMIEAIERYFKRHEKYFEDGDSQEGEWEDTDTPPIKMMTLPNTVECQNCNKLFDYLKEPEIAMGAVRCPRCRIPVDQEGNIHAKEASK